MIETIMFSAVIGVAVFKLITIFTDEFDNMMKGGGE